MAETSSITILASAGAGWFLGQLTAVAKLLYNRFVLRRAIREEVADLHDGGAVRVWMALGRSLQLHVVGGVDPSLPLPLKNEVYRLHYKEALLALNRYQRKELEMLHQYVEEANGAIQRLKEANIKIHELHDNGESIKREAERYGDALKLAMRAAAEVQWHAKLYINHPVLPDLTPMSPEHKAYVRFVESVEKEIATIEQNAKGLTKEQFDQIYQPEIFDSIPDS
jgi:hypothetical protein